MKYDIKCMDIQKYMYVDIWNNLHQVRQKGNRFEKTHKLNVFASKKTKGSKPYSKLSKITHF